MKNNKIESDDKKNKISERAKSIQILMLGFNMVYILVTPIFLMIVLYLFVIKRFFGENKLLFGGLIIFGMISGYISLFKEIKRIGSNK